MAEPTAHADAARDILNDMKQDGEMDDISLSDSEIEPPPPEHEEADAAVFCHEAPPPPMPLMQLNDNGKSLLKNKRSVRTSGTKKTCELTAANRKADAANWLWSLVKGGH